MLPKIPSFARPLLQCLCLVGICCAAAPEALLAQVAQPLLEAPPPQKAYFSFNSNPRFCDTSRVRGWFSWYVDGSGFCYVVPMTNLETADRYASELLENSFHVVISGFGLRDANGEPVEYIPPQR